MNKEVHNSHIYQSYTLQNCINEYKLNEAVEEIQCIPWHMPMTEKAKNSSTKICLPDKHEMFMETLADETLLMANNDDDNDIHCHEPCQSVTYEHSMYSSNLQAASECEKLKRFYASANLSFPVAFPHFSLLISADGYANFDAEDLHQAMIGDSCNMLLKGTAILKIKPGKMHVNVVKQRKRVSFSSQLSNFGKT